MKIAVLGGTGRTGRLLLAELMRRGHTVTALVRNPDRLPPETGVTVVVGDSRDQRALAELMAGADVVVSALGPSSSKETTLQRDTASAVIEAMRAAGVSRYVGVSAAGIDVPGDKKSRRDRFISWLAQHLSGPVAQDKAGEYELWAASDRDWTLVRVPRLVDSAPTAAVEHDAHRSARSTKLSRADAAAFLADLAENGNYPRQAPLVANAS
jgi:nucleoside-diphosphate-sugar epimerase